MYNVNKVAGRKEKSTTTSISNPESKILRFQPATETQYITPRFES